MAGAVLRLIPFPDNNRHLFQTVGPRCCAAIIPGGAAAPPYPLHRLSLGIGITSGKIVESQEINQPCFGETLTVFEFKSRILLH
jgi:hypothetical protein